MDAAVHRAEVCYLPLLGAALLRPATPPLQNYEPFATVAILPIGLPLRECHRRTISAKHDGGSPAALCDFHPNGGFLVMSRLLTVIGTFVALLAVSPALAEKSIVVSSTTSTQDSGLFGHILPLFKAKTGIDVKVVAQGAGVKRYPVMYNDFILVGPESDPAGIKGMTDITEAFKAIKAKGAPFISRGDRSGTHIAELALWKAA